MSGKHWISAVIWPSLARAWNWDPGCAFTHLPGLTRKRAGPRRDLWPPRPVMRLVIERGTVTLPVDANYWAPRGGGARRWHDERCCVLQNVFIHLKWQVCRLPWHRETASGGEAKTTCHLCVCVCAQSFVYCHRGGSPPQRVRNNLLFFPFSRLRSSIVSF